MYFMNTIFIYDFITENTQEAVVPQPGRPQLSYRSVIATPQVGARPDPSVFYCLILPNFFVVFYCPFLPKVYFAFYCPT